MAANSFTNNQSLTSNNDTSDLVQDALLVLYDECCKPTYKREKPIRDFLDYIQPIVVKMKEHRISATNFEKITTLDQREYSEVNEVKNKITGQTFAMKRMSKCAVLDKVGTISFREERDILVTGDPQWICKLHYAFQDNDNLYFLMEYYRGGNLLNLLSNHDDLFSEAWTRFYIAEMILAIDSLHKLGYVHRDIKPDNILIDDEGHIRLADFGSSMRMEADGTVRSKIAVGTPDYISPEVLCSMNTGQDRYGKECDWWGLGCVMWELLFTLPPFYNDETNEHMALMKTYAQITAQAQKENTLIFPDDIEVSENAKDLLRKLLCSKNNRLGKNGLRDFQTHPFFRSIDWNQIRHTEAPQKFTGERPIGAANSPEKPNDGNSRSFRSLPSNMDLSKQIPFIGFTYSNTRSTCTTTSPPVLTSKVVTVTPVSAVPDSSSRDWQLERASLQAEMTRLQKLHERKQEEATSEKRLLQKEIDRLQELCNSKREVLLKEKISQSESELRKFYTDQSEEITNGYITYLKNILLFFEQFANSNEIIEENNEAMSLDEIRNRLDEQMHQFAKHYHSLWKKSSPTSEKFVSSDCSLLISKFKKKFDELSSNNDHQQKTSIQEDDYNHSPVLQNLNKFLTHLYQKTIEILHEKTAFENQLSKHIGVNGTGSISSLTPSRSRAYSHAMKLEHMKAQTELQVKMARDAEIRRQLEEELEQVRAEMSQKIDKLKRLKEENQSIRRQLSEQSVAPSPRTSSTDNPKPLTPLSSGVHDFIIETFSTPQICVHCHDVLIGLTRQGFICKRCKIVSHLDCLEKVSGSCESPSIDRTDLSHQHILYVSERSNMKKNLSKCQLFHHQSKLLIYEFVSPTNIIRAQPSFIIDLTDNNFHVSSIDEHDRISDSKENLSSIFKITSIKLSSRKQPKKLYIRANNATEKEFYVDRLSNFFQSAQTLRKTVLKEYENFITKEIFEINLKKITAAFVLSDMERFLIATEDALYLFDVYNNSPTKIYDKKIYQLSLISNDRLLILLCGTKRSIRIKSFPRLIDRLEPTDDVEILQTQDATLFAVNPQSLTLAVAMRKSRLIFVYQINPPPSRYRCTLTHQLNTTEIVTYLDISIVPMDKNDEQILWYGYGSTFLAQRIADKCPSVVLLAEKDPTLHVFREKPSQIMRVVPLPNSSSKSELLLVFRNLGVYIDYLTGMRTRHQELMWAGLPTTTSYSEPYLLVYTEKSIDIYDVVSGRWLQSLALAKTYPLTLDGTISLSYDPGLTKNHVRLISIAAENRSTISRNIPDRSSSLLISEPISCVDLEHMGREEALEILANNTLQGQNLSRYSNLSITQSLDSVSREEIDGLSQISNETQRKSDPSHRKTRQTPKPAVDKRVSPIWIPSHESDEGDRL